MNWLYLKKPESVSSHHDEAEQLKMWGIKHVILEKSCTACLIFMGVLLIVMLVCYSFNLFI